MSTQVNSNQSVATVTTGPRLMAGALDRTTPSGKVAGKVLSYVQGVAGGDVKADLKARGLKGKQLRAEVRNVLTGKSDRAWAHFQAELSVQRSLGYVPVKTTSNKANDVLTSRLELSSKGRSMQVVETMSDEELLKVLEARKQARIPAIEVSEVKPDAPKSEEPKSEAPKQPTK